MASAVSASASFHGFPPSFVNSAENSCFLRRVIAAALNKISARTLGSTVLQVSKAFLAAFKAFVHALC